MTRRTFGQQLGIGFAVVLALTVGMAVVALVSLRGAVSSYEGLLDVEVEGRLAAEQLRSIAASRSASVRGYLLTREERFISSIATWDEQFPSIIARLKSVADDEDGRALVDGVDSEWAAFKAESERIVLQRRGDGDLVTIAKHFDEAVLPRWDALQARVKAMDDRHRARLEEAFKETDHDSDVALAWLIAMAAAALVLSIGVAVYLTRTLGTRIGGSVQHVRSSSAELQAAASQQVSSAKEQASAMAEITTTISELLVAARQIASSAQRVSRIAGDAAVGAKGGEGQVRTAQEAVLSIRRQIDLLVQHMLDLGRKSQQVGGIVEIITELAEQTNILAINASIEAAGAGEAGRRFAVVGDEVRRLADRVSGSTKEIRTLVDEIRGAVNTTVMATEAGSKAVEAATGRFVELSETFRRISEGVTTTNEAAREIELSTQQQTTAVEQVNVAMNNVAQASRETEAGASQTLLTASQLAVMSNDLMRIVHNQAQVG